MKPEKNRFYGLMIGGAIGDALGSPVDHSWIGSFPWVEDYRITARFYRGERTGDTAMALCLAEQLLTYGESRPDQQLYNYLRWHLTGYLGTRSYAKTEGAQIKSMINAYFEYYNGLIEYKPREIDNTGKMLDGNGSLMRIGPVPAYFYDDAEKALQAAKLSSITTHNTKICIDCCVYITGLIWGALHGAEKTDLLKPYYSPVKDFYKDNDLLPEMKEIIEGGYKNLTEEEVIDTRGTGFAYVLNTLRVVLWGFFQFDSFREGMEGIVNLGGDANTNSCVYGYLAGAYYGLDTIPEKWRIGLMDYELIETFANNIYSHVIGEKRIPIKWGKKYDLNRFIKAQEGKFEQAIIDIKREHKTPKWRMLYIFPQIATFGEGGQAKTFAISCIQEAVEYYYESDILRERLIRATTALLETESNDAVEIFGETDALELFSCMTLFSMIAPENKIFKQVLKKFFMGTVNSETIMVYEMMREYLYSEFPTYGEVFPGYSKAVKRRLIEIFFGYDENGKSNFQKILELVKKHGCVSPALITRELRVGYHYADRARLALEELNLIKDKGTETKILY